MQYKLIDNFRKLKAKFKWNYIGLLFLDVDAFIISDMNVAVKYTQKNSATNNWYRAQILNVLKGKGSLEVFLVDFGQTVTIPWTIIKRLQPQFMTLECQVMKHNILLLFLKLTHIFFKIQLIIKILNV